MEEDRVKKLLQQAVGISEEDWGVFRAGSSGVYRFFQNLDRVVGQQIVAEVIESRYCAAGLQVGQRLVIEGGALVPEKSTAPLSALKVMVRRGANVCGRGQPGRIGSGSSGLSSAMVRWEGGGATTAGPFASWPMSTRLRRAWV